MSRSSDKLPCEQVLLQAHRRGAPKPTRGPVYNFQYHKIFDNTAAKVHLGCQYSVLFGIGVKQTINWLERNGKIDISDHYANYDRILDHWQDHRSRLTAELSE
jgi:hypothetical protein